MGTLVPSDVKGTVPPVSVAHLGSIPGVSTRRMTMPGNGTGHPDRLRCAKCKPYRLRLFEPNRGLRLEATGRTKPRYVGGGPRTTDRRIEYRCRDCGHVGWTTHIDGEGLLRRLAEKELDTRPLTWERRKNGWGQTYYAAYVDGRLYLVEKNCTWSGGYLVKIGSSREKPIAKHHLLADAKKEAEKYANSQRGRT